MSGYNRFIASLLLLHVRSRRQRRIAQPAPEPEPKAPPEAAPKRRRVEPRPEAPPEAAETPEPQQSSGHKAKIVEAAYMRQYYLDHRESLLERRRCKWRLEHPKPPPPPKNAPQFPVRGQSARWQVTAPKKAPPAKAPPAAKAPATRLSATATAPRGHVSRHQRGKAPAGMGLSMSKDASA